MLYSINQVEQKACVEVENIYFNKEIVAYSLEDRPMYQITLCS